MHTLRTEQGAHREGGGCRFGGVRAAAASGKRVPQQQPQEPGKPYVRVLVRNSNSTRPWYFLSSLLAKPPKFKFVRVDICFVYLMGAVLWISQGRLACYPPAAISLFCQTHREAALILCDVTVEGYTSEQCIQRGSTRHMVALPSIFRSKKFQGLPACEQQTKTTHFEVLPPTKRANILPRVDK